jgi:hypothetical protein
MFGQEYRPTRADGSGKWLQSQFFNLLHAQFHYHETTEKPAGQHI